MHLLRTITLFIALMAQALPAALIQRAEVPVPCTMSCCAMEAAQPAVSDCGCFTSTPQTPQRAPAQTPPAQSREVMPQVQWVALVEDFLLKLSETHISATVHHFPHEDAARTQPHVRLTVLFCSFLT